MEQKGSPASRSREASASRRGLRQRPQIGLQPALCAQQQGQGIPRPQEVRGSLADFKRAVKILPTLAEFHTNEGRALASMGRFDDSLECFAEARKLSPRDLSNMKYEGMAFLKLNRIPEALRSFDEAIQLGSSDKDLWKSRAVWELSKLWYHNRLSMDYHARSIEQVAEIFRQVGLKSKFWYIQR